MFTEGIYPIGDGMLDIDEDRLKGLLVPDDINEIYDVEQTPFARGKFAAVRRAVHKNSGVHFAAKFLKRRRRAQSSDKEIKHEIAVLTLCNGADNIVKLNAVHESRSDTALLLELATGGELQTFLDNEECLSEAQARIAMREVLKALLFLHKRSIVHLDLKPQNILLCGERVEDGLKLCDFGISRVVTEGTNVREIVGTPDYVAPEVLQYEPLSLMTDIWSVGVLTYVLLSGFSPFGGDNKQETFLNISQCALTFPEKLFGGVSAAAIDFIRRSLRIKPNDRMTASGCLEHVWLKDECSIDRQIFDKLVAMPVAKGKSAAALDGGRDADVVDEDDVEDDDEEEDEDDENDAESGDERNEEKNNERENDYDNDEDEDEDDDDDDDDEEDDELSAADNNAGIKMDSSDVEPEQPLTLANGKAHKQQQQPQSHNGHDQHHHRNGPAAATATVTATATATTNGGTVRAKTTTTTAVLNVPATRATTIPLYSTMQHPLQQQQLQQQQQQHKHNLHIAGRRHSSSAASAEANKENTFLATKKIVASNVATVALPNALSGAKTTAIATATATATIIIEQPEGQLAATSIVATITLPNGGVGSGGGGGGGAGVGVGVGGGTSCNNSLFPDAPTTPKVIRKAPTTDTSPTSVKALVKKFQLSEGNNASDKQAALHLKETHASYHHHHQQNHQQQQQQQQQQQLHVNGASVKCSRNGKSAVADNPNKLNRSLNGRSISATTTITKNGNHLSGSSMHMLNGSGRRASEPIAAVHKKQQTTTESAAATTPTIASYKSTCVFGIQCGNGSVTTTTVTAATGPNTITNGCRHSTTTALGGAAANTTTTIITAAATPTTSQPTANGSGGNSSSSSSSSTTAAAAILFSNHQQLQQHHHHAHSHPHPHHHHHHHAAKSVANNLSLDQGIIC